MTVEYLIERLKTFDKDLEVKGFVYTDDAAWLVDIRDVFIPQDIQGLPPTKKRYCFIDVEPVFPTDE